MSEHLKQDSFLTRRNWLVLAASAVSGCGGGSASTTAGLPGTGGTGIYAQGSISGFGSVIINGIRFDDTAAKVQLDGTTLRSADLRLGMVASVQGERGGDPTLGTASHIEVWSIAQGLVTKVPQGVATEFNVAGMTVQTDANTVFDGLTGASALATGQRVTVWGLQAGTDGSRWMATRVVLTAATAVVSTGLVGVVGQQPYLNGLRLTGLAAGSVLAGQLMRVQGVLSADGSLQVGSTNLQGSTSALQRQGESEIEALVTSITSPTRFMMGIFEVDASHANYVPAGAQITVGSRVEVEGTWLSGVLIAVKVDVENAQTLNTVEIEAVIDQFTSVADFVVRGQRCDATSASISHGTAADLHKDVKVKLKGTQAGNVLMVTELEIDN